MRKGFAALAVVAALATALPAAAHEIKAGAFTIIHPMARASIAGRPMAVYMAIVNDGSTPDRLVGVRAPGFEAAEMHETLEEGGVKKMRPVDAVEIPAGDTALFEPGGLHLMLFGPEKSYAEGDEFPLTLIFEKAGEVEVPVKVGGMGGMRGSGAPATE